MKCKFCEYVFTKLHIIWMPVQSTNCDAILRLNHHLSNKLTVITAVEQSSHMSLKHSTVNITRTVVACNPARLICAF